jgi:8-oxo-dGTP diphosphatase
MTELSVCPGYPTGSVSVVAAVITTEDGLLLVRKRLTSRFMLPGGKPVTGEDDLSCLVRELSEELSVGFDRASTTFLGSFTAEAANEPQLLVIARLYRIALISRPRLNAEIEELLWFDHTEASVRTDLAPLVNDQVLPLLRAADL